MVGSTARVFSELCGLSPLITAAAARQRPRFAAAAQEKGRPVGGEWQDGRTPPRRL